MPFSALRGHARGRDLLRAAGLSSLYRLVCALVYILSARHRRQLTRARAAGNAVKKYRRRDEAPTARRRRIGISTPASSIAAARCTDPSCAVSVEGPAACSAMGSCCHALLVRSMSCSANTPASTPAAACFGIGLPHPPAAASLAVAAAVAAPAPHPLRLREHVEPRAAALLPAAAPRAAAPLLAAVPRAAALSCPLPRVRAPRRARGRV
jgi:hypothetical protein